MSDLELFFVCVLLGDGGGLGLGTEMFEFNRVRCHWICPLAERLWARGLGEAVFSLLSPELPVLHSSLWSC